MDGVLRKADAVVVGAFTEAATSPAGRLNARNAVKNRPNPA
jgi:hypothetical protein